ncbi:AI-2E family transporter [Sphingomonas sp. LY29]|uniref:AI-2E family transporter n=1 Tax=unclassified Sphingomonas TaxID=196159 RepID=UPI002ADEE37C|nr:MULTISPECIES: AI-2E family transporter [unclassified Sphingomonas]MEA1072241.1 AI-2E family transporter [Sphingomonas sp. LY160]WRP25088.1 AI-2E family transporter [Sphingomonas sp. LY29]
MTEATTHEHHHHVEKPGPADFSDSLTRTESRKAIIWLGIALMIVGVIWLAQPILLIIGGMVFAIILDGGTRLLGRVLPIGRGWRLAIVTIVGFGFLAWTFYFAGTTLAEQAGALRTTVMAQANKVMEWAAGTGMMPEGGVGNLGNQLLGGVGRLTSAVSTLFGALSSIILILFIGIFIAIEPKLYDRGVAWMLPIRSRASFYEIGDHVGFVLRRLMAGRILGMVVEGVGTWLMLMWGGVPMAALLGLLTGLLAFVPNIGAVVSGVLMVAVGFSAGTDAGIWAIATYLFVQTVDGYLIVPYVAKKTVDLAPALVLAAQLIFGALFGIMGLLLADPIVATIKTTLEDLSKRKGKAPDGDALPPKQEAPPA